MTEAIKLERTWTLGERIGGGGFGTVFSASSDGKRAALKLVPKAPGAERELLFVDIGDIPRVVPIIDSGETDDSWVLVMPLAETSLREKLEEAGGRLPAQDMVAVAGDVLAALVAIDGRVVHRDLKPENVLRLDGRWCLADFGISRYAEASTAPDTRKFMMSPPYAAPERWRGEHATSAVDVYSFGVMAFEMLSGARPFTGPTTEDFREQHLHEDPPRLDGTPDGLAALVGECLYKSPAARPSAAGAATRLGRIGTPARSEGLAGLEAANRAAVARRNQKERGVSQAQSAAQQREALERDGRKALGLIGKTLLDAIVDAAPTATVSQRSPSDWTVSIGGASLQLVGSAPAGKGALAAFDVVLYASLLITVPPNDHYAGRSHSLWFCDAKTQDSYGWFETAFMVSPLVSERGFYDPFALAPNDEAKQAVEPAMGTRQVAWPFTRLEPGDLDDFIDRWAGWLGAAAAGRLEHPQSMPERPAQGSWRQVTESGDRL